MTDDELIETLERLEPPASIELTRNAVAALFSVPSSHVSLDESIDCWGNVTMAIRIGD